MKIAIVTGASGGIGAAIATRLAEAGWVVWLVARDAAKLDALARRLGSPAHALPLDLCDPEAAAVLLDAIRAQPYPVQLLVNAAGTQHFGLLADQTDAQLDAMLALNLAAPMRLIRTLWPVLGADSTVVNVGSVFGSIGFPGFAGYCASKGGLRVFTEALARESGRDGPRFIHLAPRAVDTALNSSRVAALNSALGNQVDTPDTVADALMRTLACRHREAVIGWPEKLFFRLNQLLPGAVDGAIGKQLAIVRRYAKEKDHA
ncbi:SDR family oxidoreductase [Chitinimonas sp. BJYL2]|uniref:SDR family oxidoreductase n=1 Tax=Chitinimonas sp. BJYL2 TaxID=2976696 RepID=UPI0022B41704|nr:SDR family oxidoreductase [Chitinimonas sp. BJYL2]